MNAHQDLSGGGIGSGDFFKLQDFWTTEFVDLDCFHFLGLRLSQNFHAIVFQLNSYFSRTI